MIEVDIEVAVIVGQFLLGQRDVAARCGGPTELAVPAGVETEAEVLVALLVTPRTGGSQLVKLCVLLVVGRGGVQARTVHLVALNGRLAGGRGGLRIFNLTKN